MNFFCPLTEPPTRLILKVKDPEVTTIFVVTC